MQTRIVQRLRGRPAAPVTVEFKRKRKLPAAAASTPDTRAVDEPSTGVRSPVAPTIEPPTETAPAQRVPRVLKPITLPVWTTTVVEEHVEPKPGRAKRGRPAGKAGRDTFGGLRRLLGDQPFPAAFADPDKPLPLALDAHAELAELAEPNVQPDKKTLALVRVFLRSWTAREPYLRAVAAPGSQRFGLDGSWSGAVTADQRAAARARLEAVAR
jgi:hypothetical protein